MTNLWLIIMISAAVAVVCLVAYQARCIHMSLWDFMNSQAGTTIIAFLTFLIIIGYTYITQQTLREMKEARAAEMRPYIRLRGGTTELKELYLLISNDGRTGARDVKILVDPPLDTASVSEGLQGVLKQGYYYLAPGQVLALKWADDYNKIYNEQEPGSAYEFTISYKDSLGNRPRSQNIPISLKEVCEQDVYLEPLERISRALHRLIENGIEVQAKEGSRPAIDHTRED